LPNLLGAAGGMTASPAWDVNAFVAEAAQLLRPDLTVLDATRVLVRNGPLGQSRDDVRWLDTLILGTDPVSVDAYGATLFGLSWRELAYVRQAVQMGLGPVDPSQVPVVKL
jgi:uncharacterized protein (DUF362 family)